MPENSMPSQRLPINQSGGMMSDSINGNQESVDDVIAGPGYTGSMQQILSENTGKRVAIDFLVGTSNIVRKEGILYLVGISYVVLYDNRADTYTVCNLYSIEFVTFLSENSSRLASAALKRV